MTTEDGRLSATPSMIARYIETEYGLKYSVNAIWQALQRLVERGLARRLPGGHYTLAPSWSGWFVENFVPRYGDEPVWSTRDMGKPVALKVALLLASLRGRIDPPIYRLEMFTEIRDRALVEEARRLRGKGVHMIVIYYNEELGALKVELRLWNVPLKATPGNIEAFSELGCEALKLAHEATAYAHRKQCGTQADSPSAGKAGIATLLTYRPG